MNGMLIAAALVSALDGQPWLVAAYLVLCSVITIVALLVVQSAPVASLPSAVVVR